MLWFFLIFFYQTEIISFYMIYTIGLFIDVKKTNSNCLIFWSFFGIFLGLLKKFYHSKQASWIYYGHVIQQKILNNVEALQDQKPPNKHHHHREPDTQYFTKSVIWCHCHTQYLCFKNCHIDLELLYHFIIWQTQIMLSQSI